MFLIYGSLHFHWSHYSKLSFLPLCLSAIEFLWRSLFFFIALTVTISLAVSVTGSHSFNTICWKVYIHSSIRLRYDVDAFWIVFMHFTLVCINKIMCRMHIAFNDRVSENKKMTTNWKSMIFNRVIILFEFFSPFSSSWFFFLVHMYDYPSLFFACCIFESVRFVFFFSFFLVNIITMTTY